MVIFAIAAITLRLLDFPMAPMILGFILGGMMEENLRRALLINNDSWSFLLERQLTLVILGLAVAALIVPVIVPFIRRFKKQAEKAGDNE